MKVNIVKESLLKPNKTFTLLSAFVTLLNDRLSESILLPILPSFVLLFDSKASTYGLLSCTYQLAQFTASPLIGVMSDKYGRRPVTLFCITGSIIGISILSFTVLFNWSNSIAAIPLFLLFIARLIDGLSGGTAATATTILADISSPEKRAKTFGLIGVAFGLSFFLGNIFVVIFAKNTNNNFIIPVLIASIIPIINFLLVFFYLPETRPNNDSNQTKATFKNPLKQLLKVFQEEKIKKLSLAFFIYFIAFTGLTNILIFFLQESLNWTTKASSGTLVVVGVIAIIVQGGLIGPLVKQFGEKRLTLIGSGFILVACLLLISCPQPDIEGSNNQVNLNSEIKKDIKTETQEFSKRDSELFKSQKRKDWINKTAKSPAAQSGAFTDEDRWQIHLKHQAWRKEQGRNSKVIDTQKIYDIDIRDVDKRKENKTKKRMVFNVYTAVSFLAIGAGLITPTLRALISKKLDINNQGSILSNLQGLQSLGGVLGIAMAGRVYDEFGPKSPFIAGSIILIFMIYLIAEGKNNNLNFDKKTKLS